MHIVHVEDFVHPDAGYQVNLLSRLQVKDGHRVTIVAAEMDNAPSHLSKFFGTDDIAGRDARFFKETGARIIRVPTFAFYSGRAVFHPSLFKVVRQLNPDVVFAHGQESLTAMMFTWASPRLGYPIILDCHGLEMASVHRFRRAFRSFYKRFVAPTILNHNIPVIRVVDDDYVEKCLGVPLNRTTLLSFGTDTDLFTPSLAAKSAFRQEHGLGDNAFVVVYAGKLDQQKGGAFLADSIREKFVTKSGKELVFLIVGNTDGDYGRQVETVLSQSENRVIRLPTQRYLDLLGIYRSADMAMFPRQCSMSFFEAQSCELPTLLEDNEINRGRALRANALTFKAESTEDLRAKLIDMADMPADRFEHMKAQARKYIVDQYDFVPISRQYTEVLAGAWRRFHGRDAAAVAAG